MKQQIDRWSLPFVCLSILATFYLLQYRLLHIHSFDQDELEHLHAAWLVSKGFVPYRDFFTHHMPWFYATLSPFFRYFLVEKTPENTFAFLFFARKIMWLVTAAILFLTFQLGKVWRDTKTGLVATTLLATTLIFQQKVLEVRPDVFCLIFWLVFLLCLVKSLQDTQENQRWVFLFFAAGLSLGAGLLFTQKILFAFPGLCVFALYDGFQKRLNHYFLFVVGLLIPILGTVLYFFSHHALREFFYCTLVINLKWVREIDSSFYILRLVKENPFLIFFGFSALFSKNLLRVQSSQRSPADWFLGALVISLTVGLVFLSPVPYRQSYLTLLPLLACLAANTLLKITKSKNVLASLFLIAITAYPLGRQALSLTYSDNRDQLSKIAFVMNHSREDETVLDGWTGWGVFRPHAYFYFFLHSGVSGTLGWKIRGELLSALQTGQINPKIVLLDDSLREFFPQVADFVRTHYSPTAAEPIYIRKEATSAPDAAAAI